MFGYVKPYVPELLVRELELYKAVYCGLCGQLGKRYGAAARLTLSYDFTFLSILQYGVSKNMEGPGLQKARCPFNPLKRKQMCRPDEALAFSADVAAIMLYYKLRDNLRDKRGVSRLVWLPLLPFARRGWRRAAKTRPEAEEALRTAMERQAEVECREAPGVDAACEPSAAAMAAILRHLAQEEGQHRVLERMGYLLGRFVYLCDALDDLEQDERSGNFNPFLQLVVQGREQRLERAKESLYMTVGELERTYALLEVGRCKGILDNVVYAGFRASVDEILQKKEQAK